MAGLKLVNVNKKFGEVHAVKDFNLEIQDEEFLVLVGPSGCGKSTTLRMVAGLEEITSGDIFIGDRLVNNMAPKDRDIAMVFQNYALYPHMNVYENMAFGLKLRRVPKLEIDKRVKGAAEILGIGDLLERKPRQLSGGQRQRVALGRAIVREPAVFLMDEPLSNLDAKLRVQMRTEIAKLHNRLKTTVIYVTHDQTEAMTMGDRIVVMKDGLVQQVAPPQELYDRPANVFVAGFIGSPAMNFLRCSLSEEAGGTYAVGNGVRVRIPASRSSDLKGQNGRQITLGIRPEDVECDPAFVEKHSDSIINTQVEVVEPLGAEVFLYVSCGAGNVTARVEPGMKVKDGDRLPVAFNMDKIHLFDAETEKTIL